MTFEEVAGELRRGRRVMIERKPDLGWLGAADLNAFGMDWVLKESFLLEPLPEKKVSISLKEFELAWNQTLNSSRITMMYPQFYSQLCERLGFKNEV